VFSGPQASGVRVTERVNDDRMTIRQEWTLPDGGVMVERGEMIRTKKTADK
jgi:hypothetical protein